MKKSSLLSIIFFLTIICSVNQSQAILKKEVIKSLIVFCISSGMSKYANSNFENPIFRGATIILCATTIGYYCFARHFTDLDVETNVD